MKIVRRLFVIPMADDQHGKSTMIRALVSQGLGRKMKLQRKGVRVLVSPWGREIDAYVFGRSYQEVERSEYETVENALNANDSSWRTRELIVMPSHVHPFDHSDIRDMIDIAHSAGFDVIGVSVILSSTDGDNRSDFPDIWCMNWDERWTVSNPMKTSPEGQLESLGRDLWTWICRALSP